jgi:hypothetical protein
MKWTRKSAERHSLRRPRLRFEQLEDRSLLAVVSFAINLYEDDGGVPGLPLAEDTVSVGQAFFAQVVAREHHPGFSGLASVFVDIAWDADVLDVVEPFDPRDAVTPNLPLFVGGVLHQETQPGLPFLLGNRIRDNVAHIEGLGGLASTSSQMGKPIGSDGDDRYVKTGLLGLSTTDDHFAWLHFRAEQAGEAVLSMRQGGLSIATMPVSSLSGDQLHFETQVVTVIEPSVTAKTTEHAALPANAPTVEVPPILEPPDTRVDVSLAPAPDATIVHVPVTQVPAESPLDRVVEANPESRVHPPTTTVNTTRGGETSSVSPPASFSPTSIWHNVAFPLDVDGTGRVAPVDVLIIANFLSFSPGMWELPSAQFSPPRYLDVNGDGRSTPHDALLVVNYLEFWAKPEAEGEANSSFATEIREDSPAVIPAGSEDAAIPVSERPDHVAASLRDAVFAPELFRAAKRETTVLSDTLPVSERADHVAASLRDAARTANSGRNAESGLGEAGLRGAATDIVLRARRMFQTTVHEIEDILPTLAADWFRRT